MIRNVPKAARILPLFLVAVALAAGIGWELAALSERVTGLAIGYIGALIGGAVCFLWLLFQILFGVGEFWNAFAPRANTSKMPVQPKAPVLGQKEKA
jgi:hypothetical protein